MRQAQRRHIQLAGLNPLASALTGTIGDDQKRAEVAGHPAGGRGAVLCVRHP